MKDMKQWLGSNLPNDVVRIGVVESYQMREFGSKNTTRYSLVAINKDGTMQTIRKIYSTITSKELQMEAIQLEKIIKLEQMEP